MSDPSNSAAFHDLLQTILGKQEELKEVKKLIKDIEEDVPLELEELLLSLRDLKKQVKERKEEHLKLVLENNAEYGEYREQVQTLKEEIAQAKLAFVTEAGKLSQEQGDLDRTVMVQGAPHRLQTQRELAVFVNGKAIK